MSRLLVAFALGLLAHRLVTRWRRSERGVDLEPVGPWRGGHDIRWNRTWWDVQPPDARAVSLSEYPAAYLRQKGGDAG